MAVIAPAILAETPEEFNANVERVASFAERVHIDISDGEFAPSFTVGAGQISWPGNWQVDIHAMIARPSQHVQTLAELKPAMIIFHAEVEEDLVPVLNQVKQLGIKAGIALLRPTVPKSVASLIEIADHVMIFSGTLGQYGGVASLMQLEKVRLIRNIHPEVEIGWDGGAMVENIFSLTQGGVDVVNVGGAISRSDEPEMIYHRMVNEINKHGVI